MSAQLSPWDWSLLTHGGGLPDGPLLPPFAPHRAAARAAWPESGGRIGGAPPASASPGPNDLEAASGGLLRMLAQPGVGVERAPDAGPQLFSAFSHAAGRHLPPSVLHSLFFGGEPISASAGSDKSVRMRPSDEVAPFRQVHIPAPSVAVADLSGPGDDAAVAQAARSAAAERLGGRRHRDASRVQATTARAEPGEETDQPSLRERMRLNSQDTYYRNAVLGALRLLMLQRLAATPDEPGLDPERKRVHDDLRREYQEIVADLARYDRMPSFGSPGEFSAALFGQLGGGLLSPEGWIGIGGKGASELARIIRAGMQQAATNAATDPLVQALNIKAGVQDDYDSARTGVALAGGALGGSGAKALNEALSNAGTRWLSFRDKLGGTNYDWAWRTLNRGRPDNPELRPETITSWFPTPVDIRRLHAEILDVPKSAWPVPSSQHHIFPQKKKLKEAFEKVGIDIQDYLMLMSNYEHLWKPYGIHTGGNHWNKQWLGWLDNHPNPTREQVFEQAYKMLEERRLLDRGAFGP